MNSDLHRPHPFFPAITSDDIAQTSLDDVAEQLAGLAHAVSTARRAGELHAARSADLHRLVQAFAYEHEVTPDFGWNDVDWSILAFDDRGPTKAVIALQEGDRAADTVDADTYWTSHGVKSGDERVVAEAFVAGILTYHVPSLQEAH